MQKMRKTRKGLRNYHNVVKVHFSFSLAPSLTKVTSIRHKCTISNHMIMIIVYIPE